MKYTNLRWGSAALALAALVGCGGGGGSDPATPPPTGTTVNASITSAAALAANDTETNATASFAVLQAAGVAPVTVNSPPVVNFTVFSGGKVVQGIPLTSVSSIIAKLVPGTNGNPDEWVSYTYRVRAAATAASGVTYSPAVLATLDAPAAASAVQATADTKLTGAAAATQLVYNADGYYTYTFSKDIKDIAQTNGVTFEPTLTHRVAVQVRYTNAAGEVVVANPYFDFTIGADGKAVPVTDASKTRKMVDVASCNTCHEKLAMHGGGRIDTQYCVLCHNPSTTDPNSGNSLNMSTMVHKIHSARLLKSQLAAGGENVTIRTDDFTEVGFPQDLRNCTKCHTGDEPAKLGDSPSTPQGANWKTAVSKEACLTCHANKTGSAWDTSHQVFARDAAVVGTANPTAVAKDLTNQQCKTCHAAGTPISPENVHWNQNEENAAKYKMNIESVAYDATARKVTVKYFLSDPTNVDAAYELVTPACTVSTAVPPVTTCANTTQFGNLRLYLAYQNMVGQSTATTEYSAYNNGGNVANVYAYRGTKDVNNHYTIDIPLPPDVTPVQAAASGIGPQAAFGTARVVTTGQIKEPKQQIKTNTRPRPVNTDVPGVVNTIVQHTFKEVALTGTLNPRRTIVSTAKCNACHGALGTTSGSNTLAEAFHGGGRDIVEACVVCHDSNRSSSGNLMTNGLNLYEPYQFKRMIHGIHGNSKRTSPFTHGNKVVDAFNMDGTSKTVGNPALLSTVENYAAEVAWPGVGLNCNVCHENNSYKQDLGTLGTVVMKPATSAPGVTPVALQPDPNQWLVISPKAASCTACHDSPTAIAHVTSFGAATFGDRTQAARPQETCNDCHAPGGFKGVDLVHGQK